MHALGDGGHFFLGAVLLPRVPVYICSCFVIKLEEVLLGAITAVESCGYCTFLTILLQQSRAVQRIRVIVRSA